MGKGKPRAAVDRKANKLLSRFGLECEWWDGGCPECMLPWSHDKDGGCRGNPFACRKLYHRYLASVDRPSAVIVEEFERRGRQSVDGE